MSFLAVLFALLVEQARPLAPGNAVHGLLRAWARWSSRNLDAGRSHHGWVAWSVAVLGPTLVALAIHLALWRVHPVLAFVWNVAVLYVTLGFRQFSHHFTEIRDALDMGDEAQARQLLADWQQVDASELPRSEIVRHVIEHSVLAAHRHVFGVLICFLAFWLLGLGPAGAVLYRLAEYLSRNWRERLDGTPSPALQQAAARAWRWVDHWPARFTGIGFAIVGNFEEAVASWRGDADRFAVGSDGVVLAATSGAINVRLMPLPEGSPPPEEGDPAARPDPQLAHLGSVVGLVWRSVVLWMLLLALLTLARI